MPISTNTMATIVVAKASKEPFDPKMNHPETPCIDHGVVGHIVEEYRRDVEHRAHICKRQKHPCQESLARHLQRRHRVRISTYAHTRNPAIIINWKRVPSRHTPNPDFQARRIPSHCPTILPNLPLGQEASRISQSRKPRTESMSSWRVLSIPFRRICGI